MEGSWPTVAVEVIALSSSAALSELGVSSVGPKATSLCVADVGTMSSSMG